MGMMPWTIDGCETIGDLLETSMALVNGETNRPVELIYFYSNSPNKAAYAGHACHAQ